HQLSIITTKDEHSLIRGIYLVSATGLKSGDILHTCSDVGFIKSPLPQTDAILLYASIVTPVPHTAGGIYPLTPQQYSESPLVKQIVNSFKSVTFN
ncbi:MAG TPA: hypothetical protein VLG47_02050, partial [Candidatus Saccharimonadales bacterium]|nr:hypothetical protein [Candidatus Saccharimonadales bacterium]